MSHDDFEYIYNKYFQSLYLYAISLTKNKDDALDLIENTFIKAYLSYDDITQSLQYWLIRVLRNEFIDLTRKRKKLISQDFHF